MMKQRTRWLVLLGVVLALLELDRESHATATALRAAFAADPCWRLAAEAANLRADADFVHRIEIAIAKFAAYVLNEAPNTPNHSAR